MNKIIAAEALEIIRNNITQAYTYACYNKSTKQNTSVLEEQTHRMVDFLFEQLKTPTLDEVVKAWEDAMGECEVTFNINEIKVLMPNLTKYLIKKDHVYSDRKVYSMNGFILNAINLTVRFLEAQEGKS